MIRVAIADDHPELRVALRLLLSTATDITIVCEASNGREAVRCVKRHRPDVLVMDIQMPEVDGLAAARQIADLRSATSVVLISTEEGRAISRRAAAAGARGFVPKSRLVDSLLLAIETVHRGQPFFLE
ncbi:MAG: response regulator transcription factor [Chloroflexi bacterium]|nr:response regulator transcription factor [Chloroflexota bacterium]